MAYKDAVRLKIEVELSVPSIETVYKFDLRNIISKETTYLFDLRNLAPPKEIVYLFDLFNLATKETIYVFDLGLQTVSKETTYLFDLRNLISKETVYLFDLRNLIAKETIYVFDIEGPSKEMIYKFDLKNLIAKETTYLFDLTNLAPPIEMTYLFDIFEGLERNYILKGLTPVERDAVLRGIEYDKSLYRFFLLRGLEADKQTGRDFILDGKDGFGRDFILMPQLLIEAPFILNAYEILPPGKTKRLTLLDTLNLRTTAVYRNPRDITVLKIVYGDLSAVKIPCTPLDKDGYIHHISDRPMQLISKVFVADEPKNFGYKSYTSYQDETGKGIACVIFDNPQYDKKVCVSGKGALKLDTGELIENPADLIYDVLINVQGYDMSSIDTAELSRFYADCLREEIRVACIFDEQKTIKNFLDELAENIHSHWMISDGKSVMRLKWI